jgi:hypothetical protein
MVEKWIAEMKVKTGRSLEEWIALATKEGPMEDKARRARRKMKHNLGTTERVVDFRTRGWEGR